MKTKEIPSPERNDSGYGNLRVEIHFAEALAGTINVVLYAEFDNVIEIDRNRQVLFDYSA
jgi:hypothetical protein